MLTPLIAEQRRETRRRGHGNVLVRPESPGSRDIQGIFDEKENALDS